MTDLLGNRAEPSDGCAIAAPDSSQFYRQIIRSAQEGVIVFDAELRYVVWNPFMERVMGVLANELLGKQTMEVFPQLEAVGVIGAQQQALAGQSRVLPDVCVTSPQDQRRYWFSLHYSPLFSAEHEIVGVICIVRDITERKRVDEELRHAQKMEAVGRLAGGIAHDFNNLLTAINGYASLALEAKGSPTQLREWLHEILKAGERASGLTQQLLAHSRKQVLAPAVWKLSTIVSEVQGMLRRVVGEDFPVVSALDESTGWVMVDRGQLEQIILNLAVNARDAMPGGGTLTLETKNVLLNTAYVQTHSGAKPGPHVMLAVSDQGNGMAEEVLAHLFEPFFTTKEPGKGTGLGLSTVYGIVQQSGGSIEVQSALGSGSTFRIYFPEASAVSEGAAATPVESIVSLGGSEAVLVVEDQDFVRDLTLQILKGAGYSVYSASNGEQALRLLNSGGLAVALVITDIVMPEMGGLELSRRLREQPNSPGVLYISGYPDSGTETTDAISSRYLQKPFSPSDLLVKVREILDHRHAKP
jgi:PAS domain S-box-containing protein